MTFDSNGRAHRGKGIGGGQFLHRQGTAPGIELPDNLVSIGRVAEELGVSTSWIRQLANDGRIPSGTTSGGHRRFDLDAVQRALKQDAEPKSFTRDLDGLKEDVFWSDVEQELGHVPPRARRILRHGFTEMVNNAIDHSRGEQVTVLVEDDGSSITVSIRDDGIGAFRHLSEHFGLPEIEDALIEIPKGKRTSAPERHAGEGLFFTLRMMDRAGISANGFTLQAQTRDDTEFAQGISDVHQGTEVAFRISRDTEREIADVFNRFTVLDEESGIHSFSRTTVPAHIIRAEGGFVARSEAKRVAAGLDEHRHAIFDASQLAVIGQGFADELFRVWQNAHPGTELRVKGANPVVRRMIQRTGFQGEFIA